MSLINKLCSLFSSSSSSKNPEPQAPEAFPSEEYQGFKITPAPIPEEMGFRINGTIEKEGKSHLFIRADLLPTAESCASEMVRKARQMIDQQGDRLFG